MSERLTRPIGPIVPDGIAPLETPDAISMWEMSGFPPLEVVVEAKLASTCFLFGAPDSKSYQLRGRSWHLLSHMEVARAIRAAQAQEVHCKARVILRIRESLDGFIAPLACSIEEMPLELGATWLGWPDLTENLAWPVTIRERLAARSNDYWPLDLAARALGLGSVTDSTMHVPAWHMGVSIVVPAHGVQAELAGVIHAISASAEELPSPTPWECIVVDDANESTLTLPSDLPRQVRKIRSDRRLHCSGARNLGLRAARYSLVIFVDGDTQIARNYFGQHVARHILSPNLITVSLRDHIPMGERVPSRPPDGRRDSRVEAQYEPGRLGIVPVHQSIVVCPIDETRAFRDFGHARFLGPVDLPFMVKGNNVAISTGIAREVGFPPDFVGWGPEDVCFAAKCIARGSFVVPVLSTGVFHLNHPPRSGSVQQQAGELAANLDRYQHHLDTPADGSWSLANMETIE